MAHCSWTLRLVLLLSFFALGCEVREEIEEPTGGTIEISTGNDGIDHPWSLTCPDGAIMEGEGASLLTEMAPGEYELVYQATEDYESPLPNPVTSRLDEGGDIAFNGTYRQGRGPRGHVIVTPVPDDLKVPWIITGPNGFYSTGKGLRHFRRRAVGEYTVTWLGIDGYNTPDPTTGTIEQDGTVVIHANFAPEGVPTSAVRIIVEPSDLPMKWTLSGPDEYELEGSSNYQLITDLVLGEYTVSWGPAEGYLTPSPNPESATIEHQKLTQFRGVYQELQTPTGTIEVDPQPQGIEAPWILDGPDGFQANGEGPEILAGRAIGDYTITWGDVDGSHTPGPSSATLTADGTIRFEATYVAREIPTGSIALDPNPDSILAPWTVVGTEDTYNGRGDYTLEDLPLGSFTITWGDVEGWDPPSPRAVTVTVNSGETVSVSASYTEIPVLTGTVVVAPTQSNATWSLTGPSGFADGGRGEVEFQEMEPGSYRVDWDPISGWETPANETLTLGAGQTIEFRGYYRDPTGPSLAGVNGSLDNGANVSISGDSFGAHTMDIASGLGPNGWIESNGSGTRFDQLNGANGWDVGMTSPIPATVTTERAHSGNNSVLARVIRANGHWQSVMRYSHDQPFDYIWVSFWTWFDPVRTSDSGYTQAKWFRIGDADANNTCTEIYTTSRWINHNPGMASANVYCAQTPSNTWDWDRCYADIYDHEADETLCASCSCGQPGPLLGACMNESTAENLPTPRQWTRVVVKARPSDMNVANGEFFFSVSKPGQVEETAVDWSGILTHSSGCTRFSVEPWQYFQFQNYFADSFTGDSSLHGDFFYDDLYLQFGTQARVEIGDRPTYENCTQLETQTPTQWSANSIDITLNHGGFSAGATVYVFVVREDGQASAGFPVTLQ